MNEMRKLMETASILDLYSEFTEDFATEPLADYWDKGHDVHSSIDQVDNYPSHPITVKAYNDVPSMYMKAGDELYLEPTNEIGEVYSEENGLTYDWDHIFNMMQRGQLEIQVGDSEPNMVPYEETIEEANLNESSVGDDLSELQRKLTDIVAFTEDKYWNYKKYPQLDDHKQLMEEVRMTCDALRKKVFELR